MPRDTLYRLWYFDYYAFRSSRQNSESPNGTPKKFEYLDDKGLAALEEDYSSDEELVELAPKKRRSHPARFVCLFVCLFTHLPQLSQTVTVILFYGPYAMAHQLMYSLIVPEFLKHFMMVNMCFSDKLLKSIHIDLLGMSMLLLINSTNQIYQSVLFRSVHFISNLNKYGLTFSLLFYLNFRLTMDLTKSSGKFDG